MEGHHAIAQRAKLEKELEEHKVALAECQQVVEDLRKELERIRKLENR